METEMTMTMTNKTMTTIMVNVNDTMTMTMTNATNSIGTVDEETCEFAGISLLIADILLPVGGLGVFAGWSLSITILWVLMTNDRHPLDNIQIHQSVGDTLDAMLGMPLVIAARYFSYKSVNLAGLFIYINVTIFMINYTFKNLVSILSIIKRTNQICHNSRKGFTPRSTTVKLTLFWLLSIAGPLYVLIGNVPRLTTWYWDQQEFVDLTSLILKTQAVLVFASTSIVMMVCNVRIVRFLKRHENDVRLVRIRTWHLQRAANTLVMSFVASVCSQVKYK